MKKNIDLTLGIPTKNSSKYLKELFKSIEGQSYIPNEIIFIDDCSSDETVKLIQNFSSSHKNWNIQIYRNERNLGIAKNYNKILKKSSSEWIQILDADDYLLKNYYEKTFPYLLMDYGIIITGVCSNVKIISVLNIFLSLFKKISLPNWIPVLGGLATRSGILYRKWIVENNLFPDPYFEGSDILHLIKIRKKSKTVFIPRAKVFYRVHSRATTNIEKKSNKYINYLNRLKNICFLYHLDYFIRKKLFAFLRK